MELIKELGRRIQKARKEKGLTQQELADLSHVSLKHVQGCERGVKNPSFEVLRAFCKVLNLSLDSLMNLDLPEDEQAANDIKLCRFSGADRLLDCFKYILCHVPLTAGLFHRGLVSGGFRTLTGSFATLGAVWLPD